MAIESKVQQFVHALEQGKPAKWLWGSVLAMLAGLIAIFFLFARFNGFAVSDAMDQAQIGRQIAEGKGYTTLYARPLALYLMLARRGAFQLPMPEISQAPLGPFINAAVLKVTGVGIDFSQGGAVAPADRVIAAVGFAFFAGALIVNYLLARRLFDARLAALGTGFLLATDLLWQFSFSGLPQMAMLFFFSLAMLALVAALDAQDAGRSTRKFVYAVAAALLLGVMTLGNGLGLWIFAGFWIFASLALRPRWLMAPVLTLAYLAPLLPWGWHNWRAMRNPFGLPFYDLYRGAQTERLDFLADFEPLLRFDWTNLADKTAAQLLEQLSGFTSFIGGNFVAATFFLAVVLHTYLRWQPAQFRWAVLLMWLGAVAGMAVFGIDGVVSVNQLHILFLPLMVFYGLAFLLVLWSRLEFDQPLFRTGFLVLLYATVSLPLIQGLMSMPKRMNWPPYLPPIIQRVGNWLEPAEPMASDIPWATAWYGARTSLLLPASVEQFELISGERLLGAPLAGIYLTPFSGGLPAISDIVNGRYREWARFIMREITQEDLSGWMLKTAVNLPMNGEAVFYSDRPRWREEAR